MSYLWHQSCTSVTLLHDVISEFNCSRGNGQIICLMDPLQLLYILLFSNRQPQNTSKTCILQPRTRDFQSLQIFLWNEKMKKFYIFNYEQKVNQAKSVPPPTCYIQITHREKCQEILELPNNTILQFMYLHSLYVT